MCKLGRETSHRPDIRRVDTVTPGFAFGLGERPQFKSFEFFSRK